MTRYADFHRRSLDDRDGFWAEQAQLIDWHRPFERVCDYSRPPFARWFVGGQTNLCHNAVDRHLAERAEQNALIAVSTETDEECVYSYRELHGARLLRGSSGGVCRVEGPTGSRSRRH